VLLTLADDEVHIWTLQVDSLDLRADLPRDCGLLSAEEMNRAAHYLAARDRQRYIATRVLARNALSRYEPVAPQAWLFSKTPFGRPFVSAQTGLSRSISFSISHSREVIVFAVAREPVLGVDIERIESRVPTATAAQFFTPLEAAAIFECEPERRAALFYQHWTLKEAYLKALGKGLHQSLRSIEFRIARSTIFAALRPSPGDEREDCEFWSLQFSPTHMGALCVKRGPPGGWRLRGWRWLAPQAEQPWTWLQRGHLA
jgi:4'-phosphopantetheinyl transferase